MNDAVLRADDIVKGLLDFSKLSKLDTALKNLNEVIGESLALVKHQLDRYHIEVVKDFGSNLPQVRIDRNKIQQVFVNLFMNAIYSMPDGGQLKIKTCARYPKDGPADIFVDIEDTGTGIPEDILDKIFDPFFTTRRDMGGTGLGLSIARTIINLHEGKIGIGNRKDCRGTKVTLMFKI
jgi:signal transduction histidine kinase